MLSPYLQTDTNILCIIIIGYVSHDVELLLLCHSRGNNQLTLNTAMKFEWVTDIMIKTRPKQGGLAPTIWVIL